MSEKYSPQGGAGDLSRTGSVAGGLGGIVSGGFLKLGYIPVSQVMMMVMMMMTLIVVVMVMVVIMEMVMEMAWGNCVRIYSSDDEDELICTNTGYLSSAFKSMMLEYICVMSDT